MERVDNLFEIPHCSFAFAQDKVRNDNSCKFASSCNYSE